MGGNAFPDAERLTKKEYEDVIGYLKLDYMIPFSVREKESFGDIDILSDNTDELLRQIKSMVDVIDTKKNSCGYNLLVEYEGKKFQVDLNKVESKDFEFAYNYFSWNDLGNLIGRIAHRQGLKFGHDGLWYVHRIGDNQLGEILLTNNFDEAISYLGFDAHEHIYGFDTFQRMFDWVIESKYFEARAFPLEHRNHAARMRDKKRKTYTDFLEYLKVKGHDQEWKESEKDEWLKRHIKKFPHVGLEIQRMNMEHELNKKYKELINGKIVGDTYKVEGKELGRLLSIVKEVLPRDKALTYSILSLHRGMDFAYSIYLGETDEITTET